MSTTINNINTTNTFIPYGTDPEKDKLIDDHNEFVRAAVAEQGYGLDKLVNDPSKFVRESANILLDSIEFDKHTDEVMGIINETENMLDDLLASL